MNDENRPDNDTLHAAVARMTEAAKAAHRPRLIMTADEWCTLLEPIILSSDSQRIMSELLERVGRGGDSLDELNRWSALFTNICNNVPQSDRSGKTARELLQEGRPRS